MSTYPFSHPFSQSTAPVVSGVAGTTGINLLTGTATTSNTYSGVYSGGILTTSYGGTYLYGDSPTITRQEVLKLFEDFRNEMRKRFSKENELFVSTAAASEVCHQFIKNAPTEYHDLLTSNMNLTGTQPTFHKAVCAVCESLNAHIPEITYVSDGFFLHFVDAKSACTFRLAI